MFSFSQNSLRETEFNLRLERDTEISNIYLYRCSLEGYVQCLKSTKILNCITVEIRYVSARSGEKD